MSNKNPEIDYGQLTASLRFFVEQLNKQLWTTVPGIVQSFDAATKRASVQVALQRLMTDDTLREPAVLPNVPVVFPSGGGFSIAFPLRRGDAVMLLFSRRGISQFKQSYSVSPPDKGSVMALKDAVAIPGFGPLSLALASEAGLSLQADDGSEAVTIESGKISITSSAKVEVHAPQIELGSGAVTGVVTQECACAFTGAPHPQASISVKAVKGVL